MRRLLVVVSVAVVALALGVLGMRGSGCAPSRAINALPDSISGVLKSVGDGLGFWHERCVLQRTPNPPFPPPAPSDTSMPPSGGQPPGGPPSASARPWRTVEEGAFFYRPRLFFDRREWWQPLRIDALLAERDAAGKPRHALCGLVPGEPKPRCGAVANVNIVATLLTRLASVGAQGIALNIAGRRAREYHSSDARCPTRPPGAEVMLRDCERGPAAAIYYHYSRLEDPRSGVLHVFDYWWYFRFNDVRPPSGCTLVTSFCVDHEGDWEGVRVVAADTGAVFSVDFAQHEWAPFRYIAPELAQLRHRFAPSFDVGLAGKRVAVLVAAGTHASYPFPCLANCIQGRRRKIAGRLLVFPEGSHSGTVSWPANDDTVCQQTGCLVPLPAPGERSWLTGSLGWGWAEHGEGPGPHSPATQPRYQQSKQTAADGFPPADDPPVLGQPANP